jgi:hypothetical protein
MIYTTRTSKETRHVIDHAKVSGAVSEVAGTGHELR